MYIYVFGSYWGTLRLVADAWSRLRLVWSPFTCLNIPAGSCKFYAWPENQLDSFKYYVPIWRAIWRLVHHMTMYRLSAWSAWIFTPGYRLVSLSWPGVTFRTGITPWYCKMDLKLFLTRRTHGRTDRQVTIGHRILRGPYKTIPPSMHIFLRIYKWTHAWHSYRVI